LVEKRKILQKRGAKCEYVWQLELKQLKPNTIKIKLWKVYAFMIFTDFKDSKAVTKYEIENYVIARRKNCSPFTVQGDVLELKLFLRFLIPEREKELFTFKMKKPKRTLPVDQLISRKDIYNYAAVGFRGPAQ